VVKKASVKNIMIMHLSLVHMAHRFMSILIIERHTYSDRKTHNSGISLTKLPASSFSQHHIAEVI
jgi:hypothetical protein